MPLTRPRYDGYAEWYDSWNKPHAERNAANVLDLLGPGAGLPIPVVLAIRARKPEALPHAG